jgi:predicted ATPase
MDGSGLARQVAVLRAERDHDFKDWLAHVRTALPDIKDVLSILREEDKSRYVMVEYENGLRVPAWMLSGGTLRLLALTILAYGRRDGEIYLVEEPENGVHPAALETIYQSLSSFAVGSDDLLVSNPQVFITSHSPVLLSMAEPEQLLCFSTTPEGTKIVRGDKHPALRDWQHETSLGSMLASGILG